MSEASHLTKNHLREEQEKENKPDTKLRPCCACPETKKARDECIIENGESNCTELIEAHKECMRKLGFKV